MSIVDHSGQRAKLCGYNQFNSTKSKQHPWHETGIHNHLWDSERKSKRKILITFVHFWNLNIFSNQGFFQSFVLGVKSPSMLHLASSHSGLVVSQGFGLVGIQGQGLPHISKHRLPQIAKGKGCPSNCSLLTCSLLSCLYYCARCWSLDGLGLTGFTIT